MEGREEENLLLGAGLRRYVYDIFFKNSWNLVKYCLANDDR